MTKNDFEYRKIEEGIQIEGSSQLKSRVVLPDQIEDCLVTKIGERAFADAGQINEIVFPTSLKCIGAYAFRECRGLRKLELPEQISRIGSHAFYNCRNLTSITLSSNLRYIEDGAFKNCNLIEEAILMVQENNLSTLAHLFEELQQQMTVHLVYEDKKKVSLFFPRDLVMYSEYTSRLYNPIAYGVGYQYRQTSATGNIDYVRYDSLFQGAKNQLTTEQLGEIAVNRLMTPEALSAEAASQYETYVCEHSETLMKDAILSENLERIQFLLEQKRLSEADAQMCYELAMKENQVEMGARILQYLQKFYPKISDEFEL